QAPDRDKYGAVEGHPRLIALAAEKLARENGIAVEANARILVTAGANMGFLTALLATCDTGDEVILPLPYYFNHEMAIRMIGCTPVLVETDARFQPDPERIAAAITRRTRAIVTVSP